ncbi:MAG: 4-(cytidine 5'-diphospho)-2-C-methyl-D-erythritol kinase [Kiloniellaceae bacterium]
MAARAGPCGAVRRRAWAKVNLFLHVTGRRADGYHELDSLIVFAGVGDDLEIRPSTDLTLAVDGPFAAALSAAGAPGPGAGNLVLHAAEILRARCGVAAGARLRLTKSLPVAAGLGGGSADAAAALRGLARLWALELSDAELARLGAALGADVPVCLAGRPSLVGGIGDRIAPAPPVPPAWLVLVNPGAPLATGAVYAARHGPFARPAEWSGAAADAVEFAARLAERRNDLEPAARALAPEVGQALAALAGTADCLLARMSGSGATCFGLYARRERARAAAAHIAAERPAWWVRAAPVLRHEPNGPD